MSRTSDQKADQSLPPLELAAEGRDRDEPLGDGAMQGEVVAFRVTDPAGDQSRVVARRIQPLVQQQGMEGRPADVQPRNDAENTNARLGCVIGGNGHVG